MESQRNHVRLSEIRTDYFLFLTEVEQQMLAMLIQLMQISTESVSIANEERRTLELWC